MTLDPRTRLAGVLRELRELGLDEWFLDGLTAEEARRLLVRGQLTGSSPASGPPAESARAPVSRSASDQGSDPGSSGGDELTVLAREASGCTRCGLAASRTQVVFGRGARTAELVVVGEAPGAEEDRRGLPFVGPAGKLLDLLLLSVGFPRDQVYICNVIKCRPPRNRDPQADEVAACTPWLKGQLELIRPKVLLGVGRFAGQMLTGSDASMGQMRGRVHSYDGIPVVATYHPAYLLRNPQATRGTWQDFQLLKQVLDEHD